MLKSYLTITWRRLVKDPQFTLLNLLGLSTGLACVILIYGWVTSERGMDRFHANNSRLYQVMGHIKLPDGIYTQENTPGLLAGALGREMPEIEYAVAVVSNVQDRLTAEKEKLQASAQFVDPDFFHVFSYRLMQGSKDRPFTDIHSVLLSDELAMKCFHTTQDIVGRTIRWGDDTIPYTVSGIFQHPAANSTAQFDLLFSFSLYLEKKPDLLSWYNSSPETYLLVRPEVDIRQLSARIAGYLQTKSEKAPLTLSLRKYSDKYLYNTYENGVQAGGRIGYVRLFSVIALFVLIIGCINFMNLSTAKAARRAKELGVKKVAGASRRQLIVQYLGESILMAFLAMLFALLWVLLLLPGFNMITGKQLDLHWDAGFWGTVTGIALVTGLIAGSYPALYLSGFRPAMILKGKLPNSPAELFIRKGLVVFQFTLSMLFIVSVLVIYRQMKMVQTANLGYDKEHVISFANDGQLAQIFQPFLSDLKHIPGVVNAATLGGDMTGNRSGNTEKIDWEGRLPGQAQLFNALDVDYAILDLLGIKMVKGRNFSPDYGADSASSIVMNETAVSAMGMKDPIGKTFRVWGGLYRIIGVAKDFHYQSLYEKIKPCFMRLRPIGRTFFVRLAAGQEAATLDAIGKLVQEYKPGLPFDYSFIDQAYQALYVSEQRVAVLCRYFAGLAILISCLGLFGLAAFTTQKRQKEIGIRKVIGATAGGIAIMLSRDFLKLVTLAVLIAFPLSWWLMNRWLDNFAYHISVSPMLFLLAGLSVILITLLTIGYQAIRAATANPVKSLRAE